jgi:hypothetical protein
LHIIPRLLGRYPNLAVLVFSARNMLSQIYERLQVTSRMEAVMCAEKLALLPNNRQGE